MVISPSTKFFRSSLTAIHKTNDYVTRYARTTGETTPELDTLPKGWFWFRKWHPEDMANICWYTVIHVLAFCAPFMFTWGAFWVAMGLSFLTGFGVTLGYHRLLCHRSFKVPKWLEYFFVYCGAHAFQGFKTKDQTPLRYRRLRDDDRVPGEGPVLKATLRRIGFFKLQLQKDPLFYVNTHKNHHKYADTDRDPVAPTHGFWYCNMGWFCNNHHIAAKCGELKGGEYSKVTELKAQWFYRFLHDTYFWHLTALATLLYLHGDLSYLAWGMIF
ncbi:hypothetical protein M8C21_001116 [Ambrosia artemisiifolia]|uniref:Fatty acid desaturase domain-containing protein n=1 Tax=Ambrosia artemisiifolia TaxID=4212 RepID=A0AAD5GF78_AMBAR|nr:hypothetical protein M8C21_001116 [Ambrosia artemisiifolia]